MSFFSFKKKPPPASDKSSPPAMAARLLRPQTRVDLILAQDYFTGQVDVRQAMILDVTPDEVVITQTDPPILKNMIGREVEASIVHQSFIASGSSRWGWKATLEDLRHDYQLDPEKPDSPRVAVVFMSRPRNTELEKSNVRQYYRLEITGREGITVQLMPASAPVQLLNFSVGGLMLSTPIPPAYTLGQELLFELNFPASAGLPVNRIQGPAALVRLEFERGDKTARMGLQFYDLSPDDERALPKILNHYMLVEQRRRNRETDD